MATTGFEDMEVEETSESETPMTEEGTPSSSNTVKIPSSMLAGKEPREGETLTVRVVSVDYDGVLVALDQAPGATDGDYEEPGPMIDQMAADNQGI